MAAIIAGRKLSQLRDERVYTTSPAYVSTIGNAIDDAEAIIRRIDEKWSATPEYQRERHVSGTMR